MAGEIGGMKIIASLLTIAALIAALYVAAHPLPPNWIPWKIPVLDGASTPFAHLQINRLRLDRAACVTALSAASALTFEELADHEKGVSCGFTNVVRATSLPVPFNNQPVATCSLMAALYWWNERLQTLAIEHMGSPVARIEQLGTYACRNVNSRITGSRSQHATANAIDISAFHFADGRRIAVVKHWEGDGAEAQFLRAVHNSACRYFNGVLGPAYNKLHADHFHLDLGPYLICR